MRDSKNRRVIKSCGEIRVYRIRRLRCIDCNKLHCELPDVITPFKHYAAKVVEGSLDETMDHCPASNSTMHRWRRWLKDRRNQLSSALASLKSWLHDEHPPLINHFSLLDTLIEIGTGWLAVATKLLINSGLWSHTQFACTPQMDHATLITNKWKECFS